MSIKLHTLAIVKPSGEPTLICGSLTRSPTGLAGFISALHRLAQELIPESGRKSKAGRYEIMFHNFGYIFVGLVHDFMSGFLSAAITDATDVKHISTVISLSIFFNEEFLREVWGHLSDEEKELNAISIDLIETFEERLAKILTSPKWFRKVKISQYFIKSPTGCVFLRYIFNEIRNRFMSFLGKKFSSKLIKKMLRFYGLSEETLRIMIDSRPEEVDESMAEKIVRFGKMLREIIKKTQKAFASRSLENIDILAGD